MLHDLDGIDYTRRLAQSYLDKALPHLEQVAKSKYKDLLLAWSDFMIQREF